MKTGSELKNEIVEMLRADPVLSSSSIKADVLGNMVWVSGEVDSYYKKLEVKQIIEKIADKKHVCYNIHVALPLNMITADADIKQAIVNALQTAMLENDINIRVYAGVVVLSGFTDNDQHKQDALQAILKIPGILNVWNFIKVLPKNLPVLKNKTFEKEPAL